MIQAILPVSDREPIRRNLDRIEMCLKSLNFFWAGSSPFVVHVVMPDQEFKAITDRFSHFETMLNLDIRLVVESTMSRTLTSAGPGKGTAKQMLIKLAAFEIVETEFYLTLDTDVLACKRFDHNTFHKNGKWLTEWAKPTLYEWWFESAAVLNYPLRREELARDRIHVTPQIMSTEICKQLAQRLGTISGRDWTEYLLDVYSGNHPNIWTEYTMYDLFGSDTGALEEKFLSAPEIPTDYRLHCDDESIWYAESFQRWQPERALTNETAGYFMVIQSITAHDLDFDATRKRWYEGMKKIYPYFS